MIRNIHPGSGFFHPRSQIQGSIKHRIPDPDPQHWHWEVGWPDPELVFYWSHVLL
jgi:hypothetical protein